MRASAVEGERESNVQLLLALFQISAVPSLMPGEDRCRTLHYSLGKIADCSILSLQDGFR